MELIQPVLKDDELLADIAAARSQTDRFHLWWLGQSGFLVQWQGRHLLIDPYLSDSLTKKYAATDKPHVRMTAIPIAPERLDFIDVVTSSHNHTDHLDHETLWPLRRANPQLLDDHPGSQPRLRRRPLADRSAMAARRKRRHDGQRRRLPIHRPGFGARTVGNRRAGELPMSRLSDPLQPVDDLSSRRRRAL